MREVAVCRDCRQQECVCEELTAWFDENRHLMEPNLENEQDEKRCIACFFAPCQCASGLKKRMEKL